MQYSKENIKIQKYIVVVAIVLFIIKIIAWQITGSVAILTDSLESIVNVMSSFLGLYSLQLAAVPRDRSHPYGHGKVEFISAGIEGVLISLAGLFIVYRAVASFFNPTEITRLDTGLYIIAISAVVNYLFGFWAVKTGEKNSSPALLASGQHLKTDTYTTIGIILGLLLLKLTGLWWIDGLTALIFALVIMFTGYKIVRSAIAGIMDESDEQLLEKMVNYLQENRDPNWVDIHNLRIIKYGAVLHIDCHLTLPWYFNIKQGHDETDKLQSLITDKFGSQIELMIHTDYCEDFSCQICQVANCAERKAPFVKQIKWTVENVTSKEKHRL